MDGYESIVLPAPIPDAIALTATLRDTYVALARHRASWARPFPAPAHSVDRTTRRTDGRRHDGTEQ